LAVDPSPGFIEFAKQHLTDPRITFHVGDTFSLPRLHPNIDAAVSGLALNFIPEPVAALQAIRQTLRPNGLLAFYVWDYARKMEMLRYFWDSVTALDPDARQMHLISSARMPGCATSM